MRMLAPLNGTRRALVAVLVVGLAGFVSFVAAPAAQAADPTDCPYADAAGTAVVYRWVGSAPGSWDSAARWQHGAGDLPGVPNDETGSDDVPDLTTTYVCIPEGADVSLDNTGKRYKFVQSIFVDDNATIRIGTGAGLLIARTTESLARPGSLIDVNQATFGGEGTLRTEGTLRITAAGSAAALSTVPITLTSNAAYANQHGQLVIGDGGTLETVGNTVIRLGYQVDVRGTARLTTGYLAADWGTRVRLLPKVVGPGVGELVIPTDYGFYQGYLDSDLGGAPVPLNALVNDGRIRKTGGTGTSVVDGAYSGSGEVVVATGTIALPDSGTDHGVVSHGLTLSTGRCDSNSVGAPGPACTPTSDPAVDPQSVSLTVPAGNVVPVDVRVREVPTAANSVVPGTYQNVVEAHADPADLVATSADPVIVDLRYTDPSAVADTDEGLAVGRIPDGQGVIWLPDCVGHLVPAPAKSCVDRGDSTTGADNVTMVVRTLETSRFVIRARSYVELPTPSPVDRTPPETAVTGVAAGKKRATLTFAATESATFSCRLDKRAWKACASPVTFKHLAKGRHTVRVVATDASGNVDASPAVRSFKVGRKHH